jgi:hypothetical protein
MSHLPAYKFKLLKMQMVQVSVPARVSRKSLRMLFQVGAELAKPNNVGRAI